MWNYSSANRFRAAIPVSAPGAQSTYDLVAGLRGMAVALLFPEVADLPPQLPGFVEEVSPGAITLGLAAPLPTLEQGHPFMVEVLAGPGVLRFQTSAAAPVGAGETRLFAALPRQIETVQRRMHSRAALCAQVLFSSAGPRSDPLPAAGAQGVGQTLDLSATGLRMTTSAPLRVGQLLYISLNTPDGTAYRGIGARVARAHQDEGRCTAALAFTGISAEIENDLVRTVYRLQMRNLAPR